MFFVVGGTKKDVIVDMVFVIMRCDNVGIIVSKKTCGISLTDRVCALRIDITGSKRLDEMVGFDRVFLPVRSSVERNISSADSTEQA